MTQLIVNADDLGWSEPVNRAILHAYEHGIVTSTTVMINLPDAPAGLEKALRHAPELGIGLHVNLTAGGPVTAHATIPSLVDDNGQFFDITRLPEIVSRWDGDEVYEEIAAQIERFRALSGRLPTHLDSHYHVAFLHPLAFEAILALAAEYALPLRGTAIGRLDDQSVVQQVQAYMPYLPQAFIVNLVEELKDVSQRSPNGYWPTYFENRFHQPNNTLGDLLNILTDVGKQTQPVEMLCHPGYADDPSTANSESRQRELEALCHPATQEVVSKMGIELINYKVFSRSG